MTRYRLTKDHFIADPDNPQAGPLLHIAGTEVEYGDAVPTLGMEGIDDEGRAKIKARADEEREKKRAAAAQAPGKSTTIMDRVVPRVEEEPEQPLHRRRGR